jgi:prepilin-type processing-associated H-X9-DG protein
MGGAMLEVRQNGAANIAFADAEGDLADITTYDVPAANGIIQVIDKVLLPPSRAGTA